MVLVGFPERDYDSIRSGRHGFVGVDFHDLQFGEFVKIISSTFNTKSL